MKIAVIVPTIRQECLDKFLKAWKPLFKKHNVELFIVRDGDDPEVEYLKRKTKLSDLHRDKSLQQLIYNKSDVVRNFGFMIAEAFYNPDVYITLDDDTLPEGDTIQDHLNALEMRAPANWMSSASEYMRGVPYGVREEREVVVSHGIWHGVYDYDAPTQLVKGNPPATFYKGSIPHGVYFPFCGMNVAFKKKALPYMYYAPMGHRVGLDRFGDIWLGITLKRECDSRDWAIVTGYSAVQHNKASNVFKNLQKEAIGLELNETFWKGDESHPYFKEYRERREQWQKLVQKYQ